MANAKQPATRKPKKAAKKGTAKAAKPVRRPTGAKTVDEYLAQLDPPNRRALAKLRAQIREAAPDAAEVISYQIPTYRLNGNLVHFAAQPKHLALYAVGLDMVEELGGKGYDVYGQTVRFTARKPLPAAVVKQIVRKRVAENERHARSWPTAGSGRLGAATRP